MNTNIAEDWDGIENVIAWICLSKRISEKRKTYVPKSENILRVAVRLFFNFEGMVSYQYFTLRNLRKFYSLFRACFRVKDAK